TLTLSACTLAGNAGFSGGAIFNDGTLTLTNSTLSGNRGFLGGALYNFYGGTLAVIGSTFTHNSAPRGGAGGAIVNEGVLSVTNSTLARNATGIRGGGISNIGTLTLTNCTLVGNSAGLNSGGIYTDGVTTLFNSIVGGNTLADGTTPSDLGG